MGKKDDLDLTPRAGARENNLPASADPVLARVDIALVLFERFVEAVENIAADMQDFVQGAGEEPEDQKP